MRFRLGLISREPEAHIDVVLTIDGQTMRGMSGARVPVVRRNDLKILRPAARRPAWSAKYPNNPIAQ